RPDGGGGLAAVRARAGHPRHRGPGGPARRIPVLELRLPGRLQPELRVRHPAQDGAHRARSGLGGQRLHRHRPGADPGRHRELPERVRLGGHEAQPLHPARPGARRLHRRLAGRAAGARTGRGRRRRGGGGRRGRRGAARGWRRDGGGGRRGPRRRAGGAVTMRPPRGRRLGGAVAAAAALLLALPALLAGCRTPDEGATTTLRFWAMGREAEVVAELLPAFEREHPGIRVELQAIPWTAAHEKLLTAYAANGLPDLLQLGNTWIPEFAAIDALRPLDARVAASGVVDAGDYFEGILDTNRVDGRLVGVPWYVDTRLLFYRKDILREAGVAAPPRTWDEWAAAMEAVRRHAGPGRYAILLPLNEFEPPLSLALQQPDPL